MTTQNQYVTIGMVTQKVLAAAEYQSTAVRTMNSQFGKEYAITGAKAGQTVNVRLATQYDAVLNDIGQNSNPLEIARQPIVQETIALILDKEVSVPTTISLTDAALWYNDTSITNETTNMAIAISNKFDNTVYNKVISDVANFVGSPTQSLTTSTLVDANTMLSDRGIVMPASDTFLVLNNNAYGQLVKGVGVANLFNPVSEISAIYKNAHILGYLSDFTVLKNQNIPTHTVGNYDGTNISGGAVSVTANVAEGASQVSVTGFVAGNTLKAGDLIWFGIEGQSSLVESTTTVSPILNTGRKKSFVVTADTTADGSGNMVISVSPSIYFLSPVKKNVSRQIVTGDKLQVLGASKSSYIKNVAYHKDSFYLAHAIYPKLGPNVEQASKASKNGAFSMTMIQWGDGYRRTSNLTLMAMFGSRALLPDRATLVISKVGL